MWEQILGSGPQAYGYYKLWDQLDDAKGDVGNQIGNLQQGVDERTSFTPWGVTSAFGSGGYNPQTGNVNYNLSDAAGAGAGQLWGSGLNMMGRAAQDPYQREQDIYERIRATQRPEEGRRFNQLEQQQFNRGRMGMGGSQYGGTPERFAYEKARAEAQNNAMLGAMGQAQNEAMNQYNIGAGLFGQSFMPHKMLQSQMGQGLQNQQLLQNAQLNNANLWAQLGLGGMTARENYANMQAKMLGDMMTSAGSFGGGLGGVFDKSGGLGGLWDMIAGGGRSGGTVGPPTPSLFERAGSWIRGWGDDDSWFS
jgi:hypothetical protein